MAILFENKILKDPSLSALQLYLKNVHMQNILKIDSYMSQDKDECKIAGKMYKFKMMYIV